MVRNAFAVLAVTLLGLINAAPSPAAINPLNSRFDFVEDDLSGSGLEAGEAPVKQAQRRAVVWLRVRSDASRAALLDLIDELPRLFEQYFPECRGDRVLARVVWPLVRGMYEDRCLTVEDIVSESALAPAEAERGLGALAADGLVRLAAARQGMRQVMPTDALRRRGNDFADRLYDALDAALSGPARPRSASPRRALRPRPSRNRRGA